MVFDNAWIREEYILLYSIGVILTDDAHWRVFTLFGSIPQIMYMVNDWLSTTVYNCLICHFDVIESSVLYMIQKFPFEVIIQINEMTDWICLIIEVNCGLTYVRINILTVISPDNEVL